MSKLKYTPWSKEFIDFLNNLQCDNSFHGYTCGNCREHLIATIRGWICKYCEYTQDFALDWFDEKEELLNRKKIS